MFHYTRVMKQITYIALISLFIFSCGRQEKMVSESTDKQEIISALNNGDSAFAEELALRGQIENPEDKEYTYYLAQAYSQKANIDIYTLFPLVKMQVFDLAISEWQQAKEYEKRQSDSVSLALIGDNEERKKLGSEEALLLQLQKINHIKEEEFTLDKEVEYLYCHSTSYDFQGNQIPESDQCYFNLKLTTEHEDLKDFTLSLQQWQRLQPQQSFEQYFETIEANQFKRNFLEYVKNEIPEKMNKIKQNNYIQKYIKALYSLFDSIPILKTIPIVEKQGMEYIFKSIDTLKLVLDNEGSNERLKNNSLRQLGLLGGYLIAYTFKSSIDMDSIRNPIDLVCKLNPAKVIENYPFLLAGIRTTLDVTIHTDFYEKNKNNIDKAQEYLKLLPKEITDEHKEKYIDDIEDFKSDNC